MYCRGTELPSVRLNVEKITPSLYDGGKEDFRDVRNMGLTWASAGYAVFIPDYIGFGLTLGKDHPYLYYPEMFISNDFTVVAQVFLHHGEDESLVPLFNTEDAYNGLTAAGGDVKKYIYQSP